MVDGGLSFQTLQFPQCKERKVGLIWRTKDGNLRSRQCLQVALVRFTRKMRGKKLSVRQ